MWPIPYVSMKRRLEARALPLYPPLGQRIPATVLHERLPETLRLAEERERTIYHETDLAVIGDVLKSYIDFVKLCERKEQEMSEPG